MKKTTLLFLTFLGLVSISNKSLNAQSTQQGNILIDVYYGGPNLTASILETTFVNAGAGQETERINSLGPVGGRISVT